MLHKLLTLIAISSGYYSLAQPGEIVFSRFTKETGLSATLVTSVIKDHKGYYWISSVNGLQRYDGKRMVMFRHEDSNPNSLPDNDVSSLMEDKKRRLWLSSGGIPCIYDPLHRGFQKIKVEYKDKKPPLIKSFYEDSQSMIWMVDLGNGLFFLDTASNTFKPYSEIWPPFFTIIQSISEDINKNRYWLATDKGILLYDVKKRTYYSSSNNPDQLACFKNNNFSNSLNLFYKDKNDIMWTQTWISGRGFAPFRYDIRKDELQLVENLEQIRGFITDQSGKTWGYGTILGQYDEKQNRFIEIKRTRGSLHGIDFNDIFNMYEDREGTLWVMSDLGLFHFNSSRQFFSTKPYIWSYRLGKPLDGNTNGFIEISDGNTIATCWNGDGPVFLDSRFNQTEPLYGYNPREITDPNYFLTWSGIQDSQGLIWIGCQHGRLLQLNPVTKKVRTLHPPEFDDRTIRSIYEDKQGNIWFGAQQSIIVKWERSTGKFRQAVTEKNVKKRTDWVLSILPGNNNDIWAGTSSGGLIRIDLLTEKVIEQYLNDKNDPKSLSNDFIRDMVILNEDTIAIATSKGIDLFSISKKIFHHITELDGMPGDGVSSMVKDGKDNLWYTTVDGVAKIHVRDKRIRTYDSRDGITENNFLLGSIIRLKDGRVVVGNTRGFVHFNPALISETVVPGDPVITGLRIFNRELPIDSLLEAGKTIQLKYSQNFITIQFASLQDIIHNPPLYYYMMEGINQNWVTSNSGEVVYSYLPPGKYNFKVKSVSSEGIFSSNTTTIPIRIKPAFYQAWWFYLLSALLVTLLIYIFYRLRLNKLLAVEKIRTRVARDLHDDMGSTLSTINILSSMAKTKIVEDPRKTSEYISKISDNSQRMMEAMDDIVWSIRPMNDSMQKITARMREFASSILEAKGIEVDFKVDEKIKEVKLDMETRRDFFLIFKEAVNNVAKYSHCTQCSIYITLQENRVVMKIEDNGVGFDLNNADSGNGLSNMQKRAEAINGILSIQSATGKGTRVSLSFT